MRRQTARRPARDTRLGAVIAAGTLAQVVAAAASAAGVELGARAVLVRLWPGASGTVAGPRPEGVWTRAASDRPAVDRYRAAPAGARRGWRRMRITSGGQTVGEIAVCAARRWPRRWLTDLAGVLGLHAVTRRALAERHASVEKDRWLRTLEQHVRMLERERRKFVALVEQSGARAFVIGADATVRWTNALIASQPPASGGSWIGRSCVELCGTILGHSGGCDRCPVTRAIAVNRNLQEEFRSATSDGERTLLMSALPIHGPDGTPEEVLATVQDLSDLTALRASESRIRALFEDSRQVAEELMRTQERLTTVLRNAPIVLFAIDRAGTFTLSEGRALERLGLLPGQVVGESVFDVYRDHPVVTRCIERALAGEAFVETVDVGTLSFETHFVTLRDATDAVAGVIGVAIDTTDRRRLEQHLLHSQKMEAMGRLASGVAHDFNNLLAVILGHAELMIARLDNRHPLAQHAAEVQRATVRGALLTRQLLAFSRKDVTTPRVLEIGAVLLGIHGMLHRLIGERIELVTTTPEEPLGARAERGPLEQVMLNLAVNARDAMPDGGRLTIDAGPVDLDDAYVAAHPDATPGPHVRLVVNDTGCGMSADVQGRAFEPFFTTKPVGSGSGLGLSTAYGLVRSWGGHVTFDSVPGRGTTFRIYLPREPVSGAVMTIDGGTATLDPGGPALGGSETILLVEDDPTVRRTMHEILTSKGYRVLEAREGADALAVARRHQGPIHLLVTDVVMPVMGGGELARTLATERPETQVLFVSGYAADERVREGVAQESARFLQKPFSLDGLAHAVREAIDGAQRGTRAA